jgi:hypothetical protein
MPIEKLWLPLSTFVKRVSGSLCYPVPPLKKYTDKLFKPFGVITNMIGDLQYMAFGKAFFKLFPDSH